MAENHPASADEAATEPEQINGYVGIIAEEFNADSTPPKTEYRSLLLGTDPVIIVEPRTDESGHTALHVSASLIPIEQVAETFHLIAGQLDEYLAENPRPGQQVADDTTGGERGE